MRSHACVFRNHGLACVKAFAVVVGLSGCAGVPLQSDVELDSGSWFQVPVLFVTDRAISDQEDDAAFYSERRGAVSYGRAVVELPQLLVQTDAVKHWWNPAAYGNRRIANARIQSVEILSRHDLMAAVNVPSGRTQPVPLANESDEPANSAGAGNAAAESSLLLYVHGYNTGFEEALLRTAQLLSDTRHGGQALLFSWPSTISIAAYAADEINAQWATPHLTALLGAIKQETVVNRLNLIGHSMGTRALTRALIDVERDFGKFTAIEHVVMAAPDIDTDIFKRDIAPRLVADGRQITLYASARDRALDISHQLHRHPRAGDVGEQVLLYPGVDTIDATAVDTSFLGHNYYGENRSIVADMRRLFATNTGPDQRERLQAVDIEDGRYWRMLPLDPVPDAPPAD